MGFIGRIVGTAVVGMVGAMVVAAAGAMSAKQRIVPTVDPADDEVTLASIFGPLAYRKPGNAFQADRPHSVSEATAQRVDDEISKIVIGAYDHAKWVIERNKPAMKALAEALLEQESLEADEIKTLLLKAGVQRD